MAEIHELIDRVADPELKAQLLSAVDKLAKQKKFGLVFEEHLPECTPLYEVPVKKGQMVSRKRGAAGEQFMALSVTDGVAKCLPKNGGDVVELPVDELVAVAEFGEPIYPYLKPIDTVCHAPDSDLWHTLIEADNYHALQLLEYLYAGKVDCIYIDPPYNTGAKDWKYNNDYVDGNDSYRHSKWLSMMQKRLRIAKRLLNPENSVLIVTIDEKEYLHLGCLLEEIFPAAKMQMVSIVIQAAGQNRKGELGRVEEYAFFVSFGNYVPAQSTDDLLNEEPSTKPEKVRWESLLRGGTGSIRSDSPNLFYPVYISKADGRIVGCGESKPLSAQPNEWVIPDGVDAIWPYKTGNVEGRWRTTQETLMALVSDGWAKAGKVTGDGKGTVWYAGKAVRQKVQSGEFVIRGLDEQGAKIIDVVSASEKTFPIKTVWNRSRHHAGWYGTNLLSGILPSRRFPFPKSLYAVEDALRVATANKPNALIVDFFAGSGTTLHAVNLLNAEDGGHRRCILVTNNEVSADEAKGLAVQGYQPGDPEWERLGIAHHVTWPRTVCSIEGHDVNGQPLKGDYLGSERPMADGFAANAAFFKLGFLDKTSVALGQQFRKMLPTLWMKAGAIGPCPTLGDGPIPPMLVLPENGFAVLTEESAFERFAEEVNAHPEIETVYLITDYEAGSRVMARSLKASRTFQLYRDYLDIFRISTGRDAR